MKSTTLEYRVLYTALKQSIEKGEYPVGSMLPPEPMLEKIYSVSRTTVRKAISLLVEDQYISVKQGRGTEVISNRARKLEGIGVRFHNVQNVTEKILASSERMYQSPASIALYPASVRVAEALNVEPGKEVYRVQLLYYVEDGTPLMYKTNYVRVDVATGLERFDQMSIDLYSVLADEFGAVFERGEETVTAVGADFVDAQVLNVKVGEPLLFFRRYAYTADKPLEFAELKMVPKFYEMRVHMQGAPRYILGHIESAEKMNT